MNHPYTQHTIDIFERMYQKLPPLVPDAVKKEFAHALEHLRDDITITSEDVEDIVISLGKKVWPYWRAFGEFVDMHQGKMGEKFLLGKLPIAVKNKYKEFKVLGGTYYDLRSGSPMNFFADKERHVLMVEIVEVDIHVRKHAIQLVLSTERKKYEDLIIDFEEVLVGIEKRLETLRTMAEDEEEHPRLADEIRDQVRSFEFGLCLLGPNTKHEHVSAAEDFFKERRKEKKVHRF